MIGYSEDPCDSYARVKNMTSGKVWVDETYETFGGESVYETYYTYIKVTPGKTYSLYFENADGGWWPCYGFTTLYWSDEINKQTPSIIDL